MDYIFVSAMMDALVLNKIVSYDIACQWSLKLLHRVRSISEHSPLLKPDVVLRFVVPKFHLPAHIPACRSKFCFMLTL